MWCNHHKLYHQNWVISSYIFLACTFGIFQFLLFSFPDPSLTSNPAVPVLENMCSALLHPDEALKASVLYAWIKLFKTISSSASQSLPSVIRDRVCIILLQTLTNASSPNLINNCIGTYAVVVLFICFVLYHYSFIILNLILKLFEHLLLVNSHFRNGRLGEKRLFSKAIMSLFY